MDLGDTYRVEYRTSDGQIRGFYSWISNQGSPHSVSYNVGPGTPLPTGLQPFFYRFHELILTKAMASPIIFKVFTPG